MKNIKYIIAVIILLILGKVIYNKVFIPKHTFKVYEVKKGALNITRFGIGNVDAEDIYAIGSQTGGKLTAVYKDIGDFVKKGDLLVTVDPVDLKDKYEEAKASLKKAQLDKSALEKDKEGLKAKLELSLKTYKRYKSLLKKGFVSQSEFDKAQSDYQNTKSQLDSTKQKLLSYDALLKQLLENIKGLQKELDTYKIVSPIDGKIIYKDAQKGETILPAKAIFKIVDPKTLWVKTYIDERLSGDVKVGDKASITLRSHANKVFKGIVKKINPTSDPVTEEREIDVAFLEIPTPFYINEQAEVTIEAKTLQDAYKVPLYCKAVYKKQTGFWTLKSDKAHFIKADIVGQNDKFFAIKNLDDKTVVIIPDNTKKALSEGMKIYR